MKEENRSNQVENNDLEAAVPSPASYPKETGLPVKAGLKDKIIYYLKAIFVIPMIYELLRDIRSTIRKQSNGIRTDFFAATSGNAQQMRNLVKDETNKYLQAIVEKPHHNVTFFFNSEGFAFNMVMDVWTIDIDYKAEEAAAGILRVYLRYGQMKKIIEKAAFDLKKWDETNENKNAVDYGIELMGTRREDGKTLFDFDSFRYVLLSEFAEGIHTYGKINFQQFNNLITHTFVQYVQPKFQDKERRDKLIQEATTLLNDHRVKKYSPEIPDRMIETLNTAELAEAIRWAKNILEVKEDDVLPSPPAFLTPGSGSDELKNDKHAEAEKLHKVLVDLAKYLPKNGKAPSPGVLHGLSIEAVEQIRDWAFAVIQAEEAKAEIPAPPMSLINACAVGK